MDYGRTSQPSNPPLVNTNQKEANDFELKNISPDQGNSLENHESPRDLRSIGNKAISNPEETESIDVIPMDQKLGEVVDRNMPPNSGKQKDDNPNPGKIIEESINKTVIKTGSRLNPAAVKEIDKAKKRLEQTDDIAGFYEEARDASDANRENSFGERLSS